VVLIVAWGATVALEVKGATATIPIVFNIGDDPVRLGLVASMARPGGNLTGTNFLSTELAAKRLDLLRELVPAAVRVAVLVSQGYDAPTLRELEPAARAMGLQIQVVRTDSGHAIHEAFAAFTREHADVLLVGSGPFFNARRIQVAQLAARHALPAIYPGRQHAEIGGLISYGASLGDAWYQVGTYAGRILQGAKPTDLPVVQSSKFELVINADTARMLGLTIPPALLAIADEVIE
jgi:putative ABC transport system substrate-binding protein